MQLRASKNPVVKLLQAIGLLVALTCVLIGIFVVVRGPGHHWRIAPAPVTENCATHVIDDGCSVFGICFKCEPVCPANTEVVASCGLVPP